MNAPKIDKIQKSIASWGSRKKRTRGLSAIQPFFTQLAEQQKTTLEMKGDMIRVEQGEIVPMVYHFSSSFRHRSFKQVIVLIYTSIRELPAWARNLTPWSSLAPTLGDHLGQNTHCPQRLPRIPHRTGHAQDQFPKLAANIYLFYLRLLKHLSP